MGMPGETGSGPSQRRTVEIACARYAGTSSETLALPPGCATSKCRSGGASALPIVLEASVEVGASEGEDSVGAANRPEHTGLFES